MSSFESTVAKMNRHTAQALQALATGLGTTWDASDVARFAAAVAAGDEYTDTLRRVFAGEKLAVEVSIDMGSVTTANVPSTPTGKGK